MFLAQLFLQSIGCLQIQLRLVLLTQLLTSVELANFVKQNVPITSRVATLGDMSNAIVKLAGGTTAVPSIYPDFLLSSHPETVALLSSDIGYVCIDRGINDSSASRDFVSYLPLVFNNSRFLVYKLPYLESSSESDLGYVAPLKYNNDYTFIILDSCIIELFLSIGE